MAISLDDNISGTGPVSTDNSFHLKSIDSEHPPVKINGIGPKTIHSTSTVPSDFLPEITEPPTGSGAVSAIAKEMGISQINTDKISENFIVELQKLIAQVFAQLSKISDSDREKTDAMQQKYLALTKESADLMRKTGNAAPLIAIGSFFILVGSQYGLDRQGQKLGKFVADQVPQIASMFTSNWQGIIKQKDNAASLELQKYIDKIGKNQSEGNKRQDCLKLLDAALEAQRKASQQG